MLLVYLLLMVFFSFLLIKSTEILVGALNRLSRASGIDKFALTSFLLALATSLPELFVGITAALERQQNLALGNILGSNIANVSLVIGGAALVGGSVAVVGDFLKQDIFYAFLAGILPLLLLMDDKLTQVEGLLLITIYGVYNFTLLRSERRALKRKTSPRKFLRRIGYNHVERHLAWIFFGAALLIFSADNLVKIAVLLAGSFGVPVMLIGLFLVAVGTSLPELSFELRAITKKQVSMVFGDLLGSIVANSTLILGLTALIRPIYLDGGFKVYLLASVAFVLIFAIFWFFVRTKKKLERWEGALLILFYFIFVFVEFWRLNGS